VIMIVTICLGWSWTAMLLLSAFQVARITGMSHHCPAIGILLKNLFKRLYLYTQQNYLRMGMVLHACSPSIQKSEAGRLWVWSQPGLYSEFQASQGYIVRSYLKKNLKTNMVSGMETDLNNWRDIEKIRLVLSWLSIRVLSTPYTILSNM
jgi:hypothetical protein